MISPRSPSFQARIRFAQGRLFALHLRTALIPHSGGRVSGCRATRNLQSLSVKNERESEQQILRPETGLRMTDVKQADSSARHRPQNDARGERCKQPGGANTYGQTDL